MPDFFLDKILNRDPDRLLYEVNERFGKLGRIMHDLGESGRSVFVGPEGLATGARSDHTADFTLTSEYNKWLFTNSGASGTVIFTLPDIEDAHPETEYTFIVLAAQTLRIQPGLTDEIYLFGDGDGMYLEASSVGTIMRIWYGDTGGWLFETNDTTEITAEVNTLVVHLSADTITGLNDNDNVTTWTDQSSAGNDATQASAAKKPIYHTNEQNSLPIVRFDGSDDDLEIPYPLGAETDFTVILVVKVASLFNYDAYLGHWDDHGGPLSIHGSSAGNIYAGTDVTNREVTAGSFYATGMNIITLKKEGTSSGNLAVTRNGGAASVNTGLTAVDPSSATLYLGWQSNTPGTPSSGNFTSADFCEVKIWKSALDATTLAAQISDLNTKWNAY